MARMFTPSRSALYGSPEREAAMGISGVGMKILGDLAELDIQTEANREMANARAAMQAVWGGIKRYMIENPGDAAEWSKWVAEQRDTFFNDVLSGVKNNRAREAVSLDFETRFAGWNEEVKTAASMQIAKNANTDFETRHNSSLQSQDYATSSEMVKAWKEGSDDIDRAHVQGLDIAATGEQAKELKRELALRIVGDFLVPLAIATGDESLFDSADEYAEGFGLKEEGSTKEYFGPDVINKWKAEYKQALKVGEYEAEQRKKAAERSLSDRMYAKEPVMHKDRIEYVASLQSLKDVVRSIPEDTFDGDDIHKWMGRIDDRIKVVTGEKEISEKKKVKAQAQARNLLAQRKYAEFDKYVEKHADELTGVYSSLLAKRYEREEAGTPENQRKKATLDSLKVLYGLRNDAVEAGVKEGEYTLQDVADIEKEYNDRIIDVHNEVAILGDEATAEQQKQVLDAILDEYAQVAAEEVSKSVWQRIKEFIGGIGYYPENLPLVGTPWSPVKTPPAKSKQTEIKTSKPLSQMTIEELRALRKKYANR